MSSVINETLLAIKAAFEAGVNIFNGGTAVSSSNPLPVGGKSVTSTYAFTRPADTTAYSINDVIADSTSAPTIMSFTNIARAVGGQSYIVKARVLTDQKTCTARMRLALFQTAPTPINDNAPKTRLWANRIISLGSIDFDPMTTEDATNSTAASAMWTSAPINIVCDAASTTIYGILSTLDAFTPASAQQFYIAIDVEQS